MKYIAEYAVSHLGNKRTGNVVLPGSSAPKVGDIFDVRIEGNMTQIQIDSVGLRKEIYGVQHASLVCSPLRTERRPNGTVSSLRNLV
jgi:hypothetical protein